MLQATWELYVTLTVGGIFWCVANPFTTLAVCLGGTALAIWKA